VTKSRVLEHASWAVSTQIMSASPFATTGGTEQKRIADLPTPDYEVPELNDLSHLRLGDQIRLEGHQTPLIVEFVGVVERETVDGTTTQYTVEASQYRDDARCYELYEQINLADGDVIQIVDDGGRPVRVYEVEF
jgi:hypothetical protein